jgi:hypothetical protein
MTDTQFLEPLPRWLRDRFQEIAHFAEQSNIRNELHPCSCKNCIVRKQEPESGPDDPLKCLCKAPHRCIGCIRERSMAAALDVLRGLHYGEIAERITDCV